MTEKELYQEWYDLGCYTTLTWEEYKEKHKERITKKD